MYMQVTRFFNVTNQFVCWPLAGHNCFRLLVMGSRACVFVVWVHIRSRGPCKVGKQTDPLCADASWERESFFGVHGAWEKQKKHMYMAIHGWLICKARVVYVLSVGTYFVLCGGFSTRGIDWRVPGLWEGTKYESWSTFIRGTLEGDPRAHV